jgi:quercetin dioxygenase-like cupin family protein
MIEKRFGYTKTDEKAIEKIISDDYAHINHMVLKNGDALAEHYSNYNIYMIVVRGNLTVKLNHQRENTYPENSIVNIPYNVKMNVYNKNNEILEFFVVKAPSPKTFNK